MNYKENFKKNFQVLNKAQRQAVEIVDGPVMVVAGPGTGKTQVLGLRIANIVYQKKALPREILALTFSEAGASSMRERLTSFLGPSAYDAQINTFHGFCNELIQNNQELFKQSKNLENIDDLAKAKLMEKIIKDMDLKYLKLFIDQMFYKEEIIKKIAFLKKEGIDSQAFKKITDNYVKQVESKKQEMLNKKTLKPKAKWRDLKKQAQKNQELWQVFEQYEKQCKKYGLYDHEDMILWVLQALEKDQAFLFKIAGQYKYILGDEYQDTNNAQNKLVNLIVGTQKQANIFVVGDDDQAIYRFQGANLANMLFFKKHFKNLKLININTNYRSSPAIIQASQALISSNQERLVNTNELEGISNKIKAAEINKEKDNRAQLYRFSDEIVEKYFITQKIKELQQQGLDLNEIAIILRTNKEVEEMAEYLMKAGLQVETSSSKSVLDSEEIDLFLDLLRAASNPKSNQSVYTAMSMSCFEISLQDYYRFNDLANKTKRNLIDYYLKLNSRQQKGSNSNGIQATEINFEDFEKIKNFFNSLLKWNKLAAKTPAVLMAERILNDSGFLNELLLNKDLQLLNKISSLFNFIKKTNQSSPKWKLKQALKDLEMMKAESIQIKARKLSLASRDVKIMTAHQAKGQEFEAVFIPSLNRGVWDGKRVNNKLKLPDSSYFFDLGWELPTIKDSVNQKLEEERRLAYVAMTRAKAYLFLSNYKNHSLNGKSKPRTDSRFIAEIQEKVKEFKDLKRYEDQSLKRVEIELKSKIKTLKNKQEQEFLQERVKKLSLSPTSLNLFLNCPRRYKYEKLLFVPKAKNKTASLGTAVHKALEKFFLKFMKTGRIEKELLLKSFEQSLEKEPLQKNDYKMASQEGRQSLEAYFNYYQDSFVKPIALETNLTARYIQEVKLSGKVDKIELISKMGKNRESELVKVVDYKTKQPGSKNMILGKTKNSNGDLFRQLVFYKLLSQLDKKFSYKVDQAEIDFIKPKKDSDEFLKHSFVINENDLENLKKELEYAIKQIKSLNFKANPQKQQCDNCDYYFICQREG
ncbi:MAG: AAA family ATPase [Candidatus Moranbacteria bacterium]|nr:AAA family ATPase [Candidatus Moranbacteria bacterium]